MAVDLAHGIRPKANFLQSYLLPYEEHDLSRPDVSPYLIHFTKDTEDRRAFDILKTILLEQRLIGGTGHIRGSHQCVCFTESPLREVANSLVNDLGYSRYAPFGIMFSKKWIYENGGRPVIYGSAEEYEMLPNELKWRHVRYAPNTEPPIDFTWEREWRLEADDLRFTSEHARIVVPHAYLAEQLVAEYEFEQESQIQLYSQIMDEQLAHQYRESYPWEIVILDE